MMTMQKLASKIARLEDKKSQARTGDIREILAILSDIMWNSGGFEIMALLHGNGLKRAKRKKK